MYISVSIPTITTAPAKTYVILGIPKLYPDSNIPGFSETGIEYSSGSLGIIVDRESIITYKVVLASETIDENTVLDSGTTTISSTSVPNEIGMESFSIDLTSLPEGNDYLFYYQMTDSREENLSDLYKFAFTSKNTP